MRPFSPFISHSEWQQSNQSTSKTPGYPTSCKLLRSSLPSSSLHLLSAARTGLSTDLRRPLRHALRFTLPTAARARKSNAWRCPLRTGGIRISFPTDRRQHCDRRPWKCRATTERRIFDHRDQGDCRAADLGSQIRGRRSLSLGLEVTRLSSTMIQ